MYSEKAAVDKLNQYGMFSYIEVYKIITCTDVASHGKTDYDLTFSL